MKPKFLRRALFLSVGPLLGGLVLQFAECALGVRAEYAAARRAGTADTFVSVLRAEPLRVVMTLLGILLALGLVVLPVILLRG